MTRIQLQTSQRTEMIPITDEVQGALDDSEIREGICHLYVPHTTAGLAINENADPMVARDFLHVIDHLIPFSDSAYRHMEDNSAAHVKAILCGTSETILVRQGRLLLGTWQGIFFCEFDGPRQRHFFVKAMAG